MSEGVCSRTHWKLFVYKEYSEEPFGDTWDKIKNDTVQKQTTLLLCDSVFDCLIMFDHTLTPKKLTQDFSLCFFFLLIKFLPFYFLDKNHQL